MGRRTRRQCVTLLEFLKVSISGGSGCGDRGWRVSHKADYKTRLLASESVYSPRQPWYAVGCDSRNGPKPTFDKTRASLSWTYISSAVVIVRSVLSKHPPVVEGRPRPQRPRKWSRRARRARSACDLRAALFRNFSFRSSAPTPAPADEATSWIGFI
ncbi:hypothetical protein EVAR_77350_1 [Eumeta japonica]|uniref:Uncharacterized protein n=1 Tax=Eumeta variegata TaxID=151549 RepID=A0A4C1UX87_EUMVA|nr:hypothetical protein EVAR_77350_1 [Eumeta japonica]